MSDPNQFDPPKKRGGLLGRLFGGKDKNSGFPNQGFDPNQGYDQYPGKKKGGGILGTLVGLGKLGEDLSGSDQNGQNGGPKREGGILGKLIEMAEESSTSSSWNGGYVNV